MSPRARRGRGRTRTLPGSRAPIDAAGGRVGPPVAHRADRRGRDDERGRVERERRAGADARDQPAADGRPGQPECDRAHELVERVGLREVAIRSRTSGTTASKAGLKNAVAGAVDRDERDDVPQRRAPPLNASSASSPTATPRIRSEATITRRRSKRSLTAPPTSRRTMVGTVIAMPTNDSAVGASDSDVDLPRHRDQEGAVADQRDRHPRPECAEVAVAQRGEQLCARRCRRAGRAPRDYAASSCSSRRAAIALEPFRVRRRPSGARRRSPGRGRSRGRGAPSSGRDCSMPSATTCSSRRLAERDDGGGQAGGLRATRRRRGTIGPS